MKNVGGDLRAAISGLLFPVAARSAPPTLKSLELVEGRAATDHQRFRPSSRFLLLPVARRFSLPRACPPGRE